MGNLEDIFKGLDGLDREILFAPIYLFFIWKFSFVASLAAQKKELSFPLKFVRIKLGYLGRVRQQRFE